MKKIDPNLIIKDDFQASIDATLMKLTSSRYMKNAIESLALSDKDILENLATFVKFEEDEQAVEQCKLAGKCLKPQGHYVLHVQRNVMGFIERKIQPCPLLEDPLKVSRFLIYEDFDAQLKDSALFETLKHRAGQKPLYVYLMKVLQGETQEGLALIGPHQSGKTYALGIFAYRYALNELGSVGMLDFSNQMNRLLSLKRVDPNSFSREISRMQNLKVLILDGLGSQLISEEMLVDILIPLFLSRHQRGKITMVSSSIPLPQLDGLFKGYKDKRILIEEWLKIIQLLTKPLVLPAMIPL